MASERSEHDRVAGNHKYTNSLIKETSPHLLQHAHNPVNWYAWGEEAFEKAKREGKAIFLSVGYSTCHWCHVMKRRLASMRAKLLSVRAKRIPLLAGKTLTNGSAAYFACKNYSCELPVTTPEGVVKALGLSKKK